MRKDRELMERVLKTTGLVLVILTVVAAVVWLIAGDAILELTR